MIPPARPFPDARARPIPAVVWVAVGLVGGSLAAFEELVPAPWIAGLSVIVAGLVVACVAGGAFGSFTDSFPWIGPLALTMLAGVGGSVGVATARVAALPAGGLARALELSRSSGRPLLVTLEGYVAGLPTPGVPKEFGGGAGGEPFETRLRVEVIALAVLPEVVPAANTTFLEVRDGWALQRSVRARGTVLVRGAGVWSGRFAGTKVRITGLLSAPRPSGDPGGPSAALSLLDLGACGTMRTSEGAVEILGARFGASSLVDSMREAALAMLRDRLEGEALALAAAVVLGIYDYAEPRLLEAHAATGALPYLAISGMNVALVAAGLGVLTRSMHSRRMRAFILLGGIFLYGNLAGFGSPVFRGVACAWLAFVARGRFRRASSGIALASAATMETLISPLSPRGASFQLSYAAVLGFVLWLRSTERTLARTPIRLPARFAVFGRSVRVGAAATLVAGLSTAGVTCHHFDQVTPAAALLAPALGALVPPLVLSGLAATLPGVAGDAGAQAFSGLASLEMWCVQVADKLPATPWVIREPPIFVGLLSIAAATALAGRPRWALGLAVVAPCAWLLEPAPPVGCVELRLFAVGHGQAAAITLPDGSAIVWDAGSREGSRRLGRRIARALRGQGVRALSLAGQSHRDADHGNALEDLLQRIPARIWLGRRAPPREEMIPLMQLAPAGPWRFERAGALTEWHAVGGAASGDTNNQSIVARVEFAGRALLLPGDLESSGVEEWIRSGAPIRSDVALLPHHGLDNGQIERFLDVCAPSIALVSNGVRYGLASARSAAESRGVPLFSTAESGTLRISIQQNGKVTVTESWNRPAKNLRLDFFADAASTTSPQCSTR
ncbi:MAG: ComEC/Rec2 family competence protein [Planctomycetes bacterium]|nr:ComEC/Rec2 family competence protein [Planctomycetota bacterium]